MPAEQQRPKQHGDPSPPGVTGPIAEAVDRARTASPPDFDLEGMLARVEETVVRERGGRAWLRSRPTPVRAMLLVLGTALAPGLFVVLAPRPDLGALPRDRFLLDLSLFIVPAALALAVVLRPIHRSPLPRCVEPVLVGLGVLGTVLVSSLPAAHVASMGAAGEQLLPSAAKCFALGSLAAFPLLAWVRLLLRDGESLWGPSALVAVLAGVIGNLAIYLHCPLVAPAHLLSGHALVLVPLLVLAAKRIP